MQQLTTRAWTVPPSSALTSHHHTPDRLCRAAHDEQTCSNESRANSAHPPMSCLCQRPPRNAVTHLDAPIQPPSPPDLDCSASPSPSVSPLFVQTCLSQCFLRPSLSHLAQTSAPGWVEPLFRCGLRGNKGIQRPRASALNRYPQM